MLIVAHRTAIGLRVKDGVILAVEKLVHSKLLMPESNRRIQTVDKHIGLVRRIPVSAISYCSNASRIRHPQDTLLTGDISLVVREMRRRATARTTELHQHFRSATISRVCIDIFHTERALQYVVDRVGLYVQAYTLYSSVRPFGCSTILGAVDKTGPSLFVIEPSGVSYVRCFLCTQFDEPDAHFSGLSRGSCGEGSPTCQDRIGEA